MRRILISLIAILVVFALTSCSKDKFGKNKKYDGVIYVGSMEDIEKNASFHNFMWNDDEPEEVYLDNPERRFDPKAPIQVMINEKMEFVLRAFSPRRVLNFKVWAKIPDYPKEFLLVKIDTIKPFLEFMQEIPFMQKNVKTLTKDGDVIEISQNEHISPDQISLTIDCEDPYYKMFSEIKTTWTVGMSSFGKTGSWQWPIKPGACREAVAMSINFAYMASSQRYRDTMTAYNGVFWRGGINDGSVDRPENLDSAQFLIYDNEELIDLALHRPNYSWGNVSGVGGLGGGGTLGLTEGAFVAHYGDDDNECMAWFHEFGHARFGHNSSVISHDGNYPTWRGVSQKVYREMCRDKQLPIYSRRFLHTRRNAAMYSSGNDGFKYHAASYHIDDPELDELDGGDW